MTNLLQNLFSSTVKASSTITDLIIYPIKSCRGISVKSSTLTKTGLDLDRQWMFVSISPEDGPIKKFVTIREISELTLIDTAFACPTFKEYESENTGDKVATPPTKPDIRKKELENENLQLVISIRKTGKSISIPARPTPSWLHQNTTLETVDIWGIQTDAYIYSPTINSIFSEFLNRPVALVYKGPTPRILRGNGAPEILGREQSTNFPDVLPLLIANEESLKELNGRLRGKGKGEIEIERFRPNIVIKGGDSIPAWSEDEWKSVRIVPKATNLPSSPTSSSWLDTLKGDTNPRGLEIDIQARCARCQVPNVEPDTGIKDKKEPWDTLVSYRRVDEGIKWKPCFGMLSVPRDEGVVSVGMGFEVLEVTQNHFYVKGF